MQFNFDLNGDAPVNEMLARITRNIQDLTPAMRSIAFLGENEARKAFDTETAPDGRAWKPSWRKQAKGGKTMTLSGRLNDSITSEADSNSAVWGTSVIYALIHQQGGEITPKNAKRLAFVGGDGFLRFANKVTIPKRPFLPQNIQEMDMDAFVDILRVHLLS